MKKYLLSLIFAAFIAILPAAAVDLFPINDISADGNTSWGYMNEDGQQVIPFQFASADPFTEEGLAAVTNSRGEMAVIDENGRRIIGFRAAPQQIEYGDHEIAFRYETETTYFTKQGQLLCTIPGAQGFFSEEGLVAVKRGNRWGYANRENTLVLPARYRQAGNFQQGYAVVQQEGNGYAVIDTAGNAIPLPSDGTPKYMEVYGGKAVILSNGNRMSLYSLETQTPVVEYMYQEISPFENGYAMLRVNGNWGIINLNGNITLPIQYHYLSYMGEGVYAARDADGYVSAIDANGNLIYRTYVYAGGFESIEHGLSWHGTMDNGIIFFSRVGGYVSKLPNAENPKILTEDVALVTMNGKQQYVRLHDVHPLYSPEREYDMEFFKVTTASYEKYLGKRNGQEYGWSLTYPVLSGMNDRTIQSKLNGMIESFFLSGPSAEARSRKLEGSYGLMVHGRVLTVWADCTCGEGEGAFIWNDSLMLDLVTGKRYNLMDDLFQTGYEPALGELLWEGFSLEEITCPRMTYSGVAFYLNQPQGRAQRAPAVQECTLSFNQLKDIIDTEGELWQALGGSAVGVLLTYQGYDDVPEGHWAYDSIKAISEADIMQGNGSLFRPDDLITVAEVCAIMVRVFRLDTTSITPPDGAAWYYTEATAAKKAGLTNGLGEQINYTAAMTRVDAMQVIANMLVQQGEPALTNQSEIESYLSQFSDNGLVPENRRAAAALCVKTGAIVGSDGKLGTQDVFTRAQFAQILNGLFITPEQLETEEPIEESAD